MISKAVKPKTSQSDIYKITNLKNVARKEKKIFFHKIGTSATNLKSQCKTNKFSHVTQTQI
jgi:hypothetical protein